jgi:hypothetical protein
LRWFNNDESSAEATAMTFEGSWGSDAAVGVVTCGSGDYE